MKIEIAEHNRMSESGSSLLRLIQNKEMPLLDLLAREAVQNALDAAAAEAQSVSVDFSTGQFEPQAINAHLKCIEAGLNERYAAYGKQKYISIRDSGTQGLTGPIRYDDEVKQDGFGNLLKLVYEISKPQQTEGAGGSWGLGKTVYFRLGIGLVIYYSRILKNGEYISRMAACMVEDENDELSLIPSRGNLKRGIAWWGAEDGENKTVPLENDPEIEQLLHEFGIAPYLGDETGTTIIIPYIQEKKLLDEVYPQNEEETKRPFWTKTIDEYLSVAVQKWYAPRIFNPEYKYGASLIPSINGESISVEDMLPLYRIVRELYISATTAEQPAYFSEKGLTVNLQPIKILKVLQKTEAGTLACIKISRAQLGMDPPDNNKSPYQQIRNTDVTCENGNGPIIMYTRKPGMIVGYDFNGSWTHGMPHSVENEYIIGLFVLNSDNRLVFSASDSSMSLDEYIRQGEKADHASWNDHNVFGYNERIVANIKKHVIDKVAKQYIEQPTDTIVKKPSGLRHVLADIILPPNNFGKRATNDSTRGSDASGNGFPRVKGRPTVSIIGTPIYSGQDVIYEYQAFSGKQDCIIQLKLITERGDLFADDWEDENKADKAFPVSIREFTLTESHPLNSSETCSHDLSVNGSSSDSDYSLEVISSKRFGVVYAVKIKNGTPKTVFKGKVRIHSEAAYFKFTFNAEEISNE